MLSILEKDIKKLEVESEEQAKKIIAAKEKDIKAA
jgi:hypothetical protein